MKLTNSKISLDAITIEFEMKRTLIDSSLMGLDSLSQMSDAMSIESGSDSDEDLDDFGLTATNPGQGKLAISRKFGNLGGRKPATVLMANLKRHQESSKPPINMARMFVNDNGAIDPHSII